MIKIARYVILLFVFSFACIGDSHPAGLLEQVWYFNLFQQKKNHLFEKAGKPFTKEISYYKNMFYIKRAKDVQNIVIDNEDQWDALANQTNKLLAAIKKIRKEYNYPFKRKMEIKAEIDQLETQIVELEAKDEHYKKIADEIEGLIEEHSILQYRNHPFFFELRKRLSTYRRTIYYSEQVFGDDPATLLEGDSEIMIVNQIRQLQEKLKNTKTYKKIVELEEKKTGLEKQIARPFGIVIQQKKKLKTKIRELKRQYYNLVVALLQSF